ncbi:MAG: hypothetical protein IPL20_16845 [Saprospiraceae bacterium]|nr:hypothetical protein [Saprospiraceae bacterium]
MNTTTVLVEHLLSGVQAFIWFVLITLSIFGFDWIHPESFKGFEAFLSFGSLAIIYPLGVFMDNLSDTILSKRVKKIKCSYIKNEKLGVGYILDKASEPLTEYFTYTRMRIRISRVTFLNFIFITITLVIFTMTRLQNVAGDSLAFILFWEIITGLFITVFAFWNWNEITNNYYKKAAKEIDKLGLDKVG